MIQYLDRRDDYGKNQNRRCVWPRLCSSAQFPICRRRPLTPRRFRCLTRSFFYGREYFVLRSGRVQMIVQADKADLAPAVSVPAVRRPRQPPEQIKGDGDQLRRRSGVRQQRRWKSCWADSRLLPWDMRRKRAGPWSMAFRPWKPSGGPAGCASPSGSSRWRTKTPSCGGSNSPPSTSRGPRR